MIMLLVGSTREMTGMESTLQPNTFVVRLINSG